jgi:N-acyl-D-aspartate/D-glutamate deacylase
MVEYDLIIRNGTIVDGSRFDKLGMKYDTPVHANDIPGGERRLIRQPVGLHYTLLNSVVTFEDGTCSGALPGKLLRSTDVAA